jgi:3-oxoacyl-[acyl-carrier protein] reductase
MIAHDLSGRTALVTGGSRGIGRAIAVAFARAGASVAVNFRSNERAAHEVCSHIEGARQAPGQPAGAGQQLCLRRLLGRRAIQVQCDVSNPGDVAQMLKTIRRDLGPVSVLVNNAGIGRRRTIDEVTEEDWDETQAVNLKGTFLVTQAVLPDMRAARWGRIIALSSVAAHTGGVVGPHYASSKAGIIGLMHYYAAYLVKEGITANAIAPGAIKTEMAANLPQLKPESVPVGRLGLPEEIAEVALMLACNGYLTGQTINVDGGRYPA